MRLPSQDDPPLLLRRVILFGGRGRFLALQGTWEWDGSDWTETTPVPSPQDRYAHAMAYDSARGKVVLFGGVSFSSGGQLSDTWEYDGTHWVEQPVPGPPLRQNHAMAYDSARGRVVLFGGYSNGIRMSDAWEWNGTAWSQKFPASHPSGRGDCAMVYDSARGRVVLFGGGSDNGEEGDTWEWDGTNWVQQLPVTSAPARRLHAMSYDGARERVLLFGGLIPTGIGIATDTWEYPGCAIAFTDRSVYGRLLFPPRCAATPAAPPPSVYDGLAVGIYEGANDRFFLSSSGGALTGQTVGVAFSPLVVDDEVHVNGVNSGLGPYTPAPGVPPFQINAPMDSNWIPLPAQEVTIPPGRSDVHFELLDTAGTIYGNTAVYLVRDCGLSVAGNGPMSLNWITHDDEVAGTHPTFEVRYGLLSELRADRNYSRASCLGHFTSTPAVDANPLPAVGEGYYYLVRGLSSCVAQGYGDSLGLVPDPRDALDVLPQCP